MGRRAPHLKVARRQARYFSTTADTFFGFASFEKNSADSVSVRLVCGGWGLAIDCKQSISLFRCRRSCFKFCAIHFFAYGSYKG
jgi:hypothetical protein